MEYPYRLYLSRLELDTGYEHSHVEDFSDFEFEYVGKNDFFEDEDVPGDEL
jgi:hypothetical protein